LTDSSLNSDRRGNNRRCMALFFKKSFTSKKSGHGRMSRTDRGFVITLVRGEASFNSIGHRGNIFDTCILRSYTNNILKYQI